MNPWIKFITLSVSVCFLVTACDRLSEQQAGNSEIPLSDEAIGLAEISLSPDQDLGTSTANLGADRLYQLDATLVEISPGGRLPPSRHLAEEIIYIVSGEGYTTMWVQPGEKPQYYEWKAGDLLSPSLNVWHQHFNTSSNTPARYVSLTTAPLTHNLFYNQGFISSSNFVFKDRWEKGITQQPEYFPEGIEGFEDGRMHVGHQLPDLLSRNLHQLRQGAWGITIRPEGDLAGNHILEMEVREKDGEEYTDEVAHLHRHPWEVIYIVLDGQGFSFMQKEGGHQRKVTWEEGDMFIVDANEYHDNRAQQGATTRYLQVKASGYFRNVGNIGGIVLYEDEHPEP